MQRILERGEIEGLDHTSIPRVRMPVGASNFLDRAARLRELADGHPLASYLLMMAHLADAQATALRHAQFPLPPDVSLDQAQAHGMPPIPAVGWQRDPGWLTILDTLLAHMLIQPSLPQAAIEAIRGLRHTATQFPADVEALADGLLQERTDVDGAAAPFVMAALQVYWTALACALGEHRLPVITPFGVCPCCGSLPVASVVRVGGREDGCRYLCCPLCSAEWHLVRVTCSHCESTKGIAYHAIEGGPEGIKAESCDQCHTYRKIFYQEKALNAEPVADDLATLTLDVLMGEAGYSRTSGNPLLWQDEGPER